MGLFKRSLAAAIVTAGSLSIPAAGVLAASAEVTDQKLNAAAAALERVVSLQKDYQQRVAQAEQPTEKERIVTEANQELTKAITEQGISVEEYETILDVAREDPAVRGKILERIRPADK